MDLLEHLSDLREVITNWRLWLPIFVALGVVWYMHNHIGAVSDPAVRWILYGSVLGIGVATGWLWNKKPD